MANDTLTEAVRKLQAFIEHPMLSDQDLSILSPTNATPPPGTTLGLTQTLVDLIVNVSTGGKTASQIAKELKDLAAKGSTVNGITADQKAIDDRIQIWCSGNPLQAKNSITSVLGVDEKKLSIIQVNSVQITPASRDIDAAVLALNMIPTIEMSRAMPFLTIDVQVGRAPITADRKLLGMSQLKFLLGGADVSNASADLTMATAITGSGPDTTLSGMEMFTSPQTLVNADPGADAARAGPVLDRFRPFMSIERLNVEITPQVGFFAYRTADLDLVLHDRSRLTEIADFVRPDLYGDTELLIEYGWSHPDTSGNNAYADLLNALRVREKYGIVNSSFNMTKTNEVKVKLKLFTKGMSDIQVVMIGNEDVKGAVDDIRNLQKAIAEIRLRLSQNNEKANKEVRGEQQLFANSEDIGSSLELDKNSIALLRSFVHQKNLTGDMASLQTALKKLYGPNGTGDPSVKQKLNTIAKSVQKKIADFKQAKKGTDPFIEKAKANFKNVPQLGKLSTIQKGHVSLGKLFSSFIGQPLARQSDKYADVQLIFYPFNAKAGAAANLNIAEFFVDVKELEMGLTAVARTRGTQLTIREFLEYIANNFVDDQSSIAYGLAGLYTNHIDPKTGTRTVSQGTKQFQDTTRLATAVQNRLLKIGSQDGAFKIPQLDIIVETVPLDPAAVGQSAASSSQRTVLKIHFFDRCATAYESLGQLLLANREEDLRTIGNIPIQDTNEHSKLAKAWLAKAQKIGLIVTPNATTGEQPRGAKTGGIKKLKDPDVKLDNVYEVKFDIEKLRAFLRQSMPTLVYGTNNTGIKDASFQTIQNALLSTVHMLRAGEAGPLSPSGLTKANLPLRTLPARVSMTTIGCPLIHYMQQFFVDFNTNTTIDNIYGVNKFTHEVSAKAFESKMELVPLDAYGRYENLSNQVGAMLQKLKKSIDDAGSSAKAPPT